jgi:hypothetical protein
VGKDAFGAGAVPRATRCSDHAERTLNFESKLRAIQEKALSVKGCRGPKRMYGSLSLRTARVNRGAKRELHFHKKKRQLDNLPCLFLAPTEPPD